MDAMGEQTFTSIGGVEVHFKQGSLATECAEHLRDGTIPERGPAGILEYDQSREEQLHILFSHVEEPEHCLNCQCVMNEGPNPRSLRTTVPCGH